MKQIIYLTGKQGSGKYTLQSSIKKSKELYIGDKITIHKIYILFMKYETIAISSPKYVKEDKEKFEKYSEQLGVLFFNINL